MYQNKMSVREPLPKCEVNGIVLTMLRFFRLFSLAPLRFTRVRNGVYRITMSRILFILGTPLPIIINLLTILLYHSILQSERQRFNFAYAFVRVLLLVIVGTPDVLTTTLVILKGHGRMRNLMSILNQIQKIRRKIGYDHSLDPSTLKIILIMAGPFMMHVAMQITGLYIEELKNFISNAGGMVVSRCNYKHLRNLYGSYLLIWEVISDLMQTEGLYLVLILYALITRIFVTTYNIWRYYNCLGKLLKL
ncbi:unnamed protein product [Danaus chrysippus]|uniref:(African queen) hypothetical protein n=1 Tax=Danaus chrysippus TaxID=151541 RepID=A0A8J2QCE0_9NEOP|nr:unnamed protein product [Danaus chrysippus]